MIPYTEVRPSGKRWKVLIDWGEGRKQTVHFDREDHARLFSTAFQLKEVARLVKKQAPSLPAFHPIQQVAGLATRALDRLSKED